MEDEIMFHFPQVVDINIPKKHMYFHVKTAYGMNHLY